MKTIFKRAVAFMLSMLMTFGVCNTAIVVYASGTRDSSKPLVYVSIGDSMTNGYGMEGYDGNSGTVNYANETYANKFAAYLAGYNGPIADDQVVFVGTNGVVDHRQLAMSGYRAEDLHWNLELDYKNEALIQKLWQYQHDGNNWDEVRTAWFGEMGFESGDYRTWTDLVDADYRYADGAAKILNTYNNNPANAQYFQSSYATPEMLQKVAAGLADPYFPSSKEDSLVMGPAYLQIASEFYQQSVKEANVISLALGNTNFGTHLLGQMIDAINGDTDKFANRYDIEDVYALADLSPELESSVRSAVAESATLFDDILDGLASDAATKEALKNMFTYCVVSYMVNYIGSIEAILTLNENESVDIILVALINAYARKDTDEVGADVVTLGDVVTKLYAIINTFIAALPTYMTATGNTLYNKANFYYAEAESVESMVDVYGDDFYKNKSTGEYVAYPGLNFDPSVLVANPNSTVRERFIEEGDGIVKGQTFGSLAGFVKSQYGIDLRRDLTVEDVINYEKLSDAEKAAFAVSDPATAMSVAFYLAFENATIKAGTGTVTLDALAASSNVISALVEVMAVFANTIVPAAAPFAPYAAAALAAKFNAVMSGYGLTTNLSAESILAVYTKSATADQIVTAAGIPDAYKQTVVTALTETVSNLDSICMMLAMPTTLSDAMVGNEAKGIARNDTVCGLLCLNARLLIGTGIGGHPSPNGHTALFEAMKKSYEEGYTPKDKLFANLLYIISEYYEEIFALVDSFAVKNADFAVRKNTSYVAFGDNSKIANDYAKYLAEFVDTSKFAPGVKSDTTLAIEGTRVSNALAAIVNDPSIVSDADIITIGYTFDKITADTFNILFDLLGVGTSTLLEAPRDWEGLLGPALAAEVLNYIDGMEADLEAQGLKVKPIEMIPDNMASLASGICKGDLTVSESARIAIEYFAYYAMEYMFLLPEVVAQIRATNPDALIMINAVSNPAANASVALGDFAFSFGGYIDTIANAVYMRTALLTMTEQNVVLVPTTEIETDFTNKVIGGELTNLTVLKELFGLLMGTADITIAPTDAGNAYIYEKMLVAVNVGVARGDFNFDGKVTAADSVYLMTALAKPEKYTFNQPTDVNGDGKFDRADAAYLLKFILSPAKYPLK